MANYIPLSQVLKRHVDDLLEKIRLDCNRPLDRCFDRRILPSNNPQEWPMSLLDEIANLTAAGKKLGDVDFVLETLEKTVFLRIDQQNGGPMKLLEQDVQVALEKLQFYLRHQNLHGKLEGLSQERRAIENAYEANGEQILQVKQEILDLEDEIAARAS